MGQLIQGGGQLRVDDVAGEALQGEKDHVVPLEHAGVLVLLRGGHAVEVVAQPLDVLVGGPLRQGAQIHVHHVGRGVDHRAGILGGVAGAVPGAAAVPQVADGAEVGIQIALHRDDHVLHIQAEHGQQAKLLHLVVGVGIHFIELAGGHVPTPGQVYHAQSHQVEDHHARRQHAGQLPVVPLKAQQPPAEDGQEQGWQEEYHDDGHAAAHGGGDHIGVVRQLVVRRRAQGAEGVIGLQNLLSDHLHHKDKGEQPGQDQGQHLVHRFMEWDGQGREQQSGRHTEGDPDGQIGQGQLHMQVEHQLQIGEQQREKEQPRHPPSGGMAAGAGQPPSVIAHIRSPLSFSACAGSYRSDPIIFLTAQQGSWKILRKS